MWLIRQTRELEGRGIIGSIKTKSIIDNKGNNMNNIGIRGNIGIGNLGNSGMETLGQMEPQYKIVLMGIDDNEEEMMSRYDGKHRDGQRLKSADADYKKRGFGPGRIVNGKFRILKRDKVDGRIRILKRDKVDGRIRILKREKDLRIKKGKVDGRIRILKKRKVDGRIRILRRENLTK